MIVGQTQRPALTKKSLIGEARKKSTESARGIVYFLTLQIYFFLLISLWTNRNPRSRNVLQPKLLHFACSSQREGVMDAFNDSF